MESEFELLDNLAEPITAFPITTTKLAWTGAAIITLTCSSIFFGSIFFLIFPILTYMVLLIRHKQAIFHQGTKRTMLIGGTWLAIPSIPLMTFILVTSGDRFFHPNFMESLFLALLLAVLFFLAGALLGMLIYPIVNKKINWKVALYVLIFLLVLFILNNF
ncbi:MAG: hypothetical protein ACRBFS_19900 [Aureispira sp.]